MSDIHKQPVPRIHIEFASPKEEAFALELAKKLKLSFTQTGPSDLVLIVNPERLELFQHRPTAIGPVFVDFVGGPTGYRRRKGRQAIEPLELAIGSRKQKFSVLDATAGFGGDAFLMVCLGCSVTALERQPIIAELLRDGLRRARQDAEVGAIIGDRFRFQCADARQYIPALTGMDRPDVIYLDPMYPSQDRKSALPRKEMQIAARLAGTDDDAGELFRIAYACAGNRVVVKRPASAEPLAANPSASYTSPKTRFDVYLRADKRSQ